MESLEMPSQVYNKLIVCMPPVDRVVESDNEWLKCGKWILNLANNMHEVDRVWMNLQYLLKSGLLLMIKATTAATVFKKVVLCYTRSGKKEAKRAANAIRSVANGDCIMFYKTNDETEVGHFRDFGYTKISIYFQTPCGKFYIRDKFRRWILVIIFLLT